MRNPDTIDGRFVPVRDQEVVAVQLDGEAVIYKEDSNTVYVLNPTATLIWDFLDGSSDLDALSEDFAAVFGADLQKMRLDLLQTVQTFGRQGLLIDVEPDDTVIQAHQLQAPDDSGSADG